MQLSVAAHHELCSMEMKFLEYQTFFETLLSSKFQTLANDVLFPFNRGRLQVVALGLRWSMFELT